MNSSDIGAVIRERRRFLGVDQKSLGELSGVAVHTVSDIESGKGNPTLAILAKITAVLGLELVVKVLDDPQR